MQRFNGAPRQPYRTHIVRTDAYQHTGLTRALCGYIVLINNAQNYPLRTNALPCATCTRLAREGVNC